eukprot:Tamp_04719.p1 GENE.Tamp_04719~~Tamp_04719.p1  ORF type:complete len:449 (-),score=97.82 Tamp_04719:1406-2752(-)
MRRVCGVFPGRYVQCENFDDANQALTEGKMLLELDHNHVIKYYDFFLHQEKGGGAPRGGKMFVVLVMSYAPDGDLFSKLERAHKEQRHIPEETIRKWLYQISQALVYIERKHIIHRDIKLANVLVDGDTLKLADFGIAKVMHGKFAQTIVGGTPCYMAPELLYKEKYNTKSDIWSLGCLVWELSCRSLLSQNKGVLGAQVLKDPGRLREMWTKMQQCGRSAELVALTKRMLEPEIEDRISAREILESSMFRKERPRAAPEIDAAMQMQTLGLTRAAADTVLPPQRAPAQQQQQQPPPRQMPDRREMHSAGRSRGGGEDAGHGVARQPDAAAVEEVEALCSEADKLQQARDYDRAERCFRKALAIHPKHTRSLCNYAYMLHVGKRDFAKAEELYKRALTVEPGRTATLCNYAYLLHSDRRLQEARQIFARARETNPEHPWVRKNEHLFS